MEAEEVRSVDLFMIVTEILPLILTPISFSIQGINLLFRLLYFLFDDSNFLPSWTDVCDMKVVLFFELDAPTDWFGGVLVES